MEPYTHARADAPHAREHMFTNTRACARTHVCGYAHTRVNTRARAHANTCARIYASIHARTYLNNEGLIDTPRLACEEVNARKVADLKKRKSS